MRQQNFRIIIWVCLTLAWCLWASILWRPYIDPLTGMTTGSYVLCVAILTVLMGGGLYLSIVKKTWRLVAGLLFLLALSSIFPVPSNSGVQLEIRNVSYALKIVTIRRDGSQSRKVQLPISPQGTSKYKTAAGEWNRAASFTVDCGKHSITTNIWAFRGRQVVVGEHEIEIKDIRTMGRTEPPEVGSSGVQ